MERDGLETDEALINQMVVFKKEQTAEKSNKKQNEKHGRQTPKTVPNKTLKSAHSRYWKDPSRTMTDCLKLAKRRKLEEYPDTEDSQNCNTPGHEEENCYVPR